MRYFAVTLTKRGITIDSISPGLTEDSIISALPPVAQQMINWTTLADLDAPNHLFNHPDFQYRAIQTVFVGRVP